MLTSIPANNPVDTFVAEKKRDYQCDICGHCVTNKQTLECHMMSHTEAGRSNLQCPHCTFNTCWPTVYKNHIWRRHTETHVRWPCSFCTTSFKEKWVLKQHFKKKHKLSKEEATAEINKIQEQKNTMRDIQLPAEKEHPT